ncbi:HIT domain-containing protein [Candidatus Bathyarchaeota archaeon]|nr:HIT domain-containing protein [Candidatus Bathyarchaeota archaeon]
MSCIFCRILDDEIPSYKVYEDEHTLAFLDKNPVEDGHTLLIPREHTQYIEDLSPRSAEVLMKSLVEIVPAIQRAMDTSDSNIAINNGPNAGQIIPHVHIHIIPRPTKNGKRLFSPPQRTKKRKKEYYEEIAEKIRNKLVT